MAVTTKNAQPDPDTPAAAPAPDAAYIKKGPPTEEQLQDILDKVPDGGVPGRMTDAEYIPDEPGEPGWPAAPVPSE